MNRAHLTEAEVESSSEGRRRRSGFGSVELPGARDPALPKQNIPQRRATIPVLKAPSRPEREWEFYRVGKGCVLLQSDAERQGHVFSYL